MVVDREQVLTRWQETIEEQKTLVQQAYERVQNFAQQIEVARRAVNEMQEFKDLILREQGQVTELQRLAEERIRREMDEFREDYEKKRRKIELRQEHLWSEQDKYNREVVERFPPLQHDIKIIESLVDQVWKVQEAYGNYVLTMANSWLEGMQKTVRERDEKVRTMEEAWQRQRRNAELFATPGRAAAHARHRHRRAAGPDQRPEITGRSNRQLPAREGRDSFARHRHRRPRRPRQVHAGPRPQRH